MKQVIRLAWVAAALLGLVLAGCTPSASAQGPDSPISLSIDNKGSDTIVNLALAWAEEYQKQHADIRISVTGGGSGIGLASLVNQTTDIANASRAIKAEEIELAKKNGFEPVEFIIARDAIAVIVNPSNPVNQLTLQQVSLIYQGKVINWKELGGDDRPIVRLSRETNSGTHVFFLETVVRLSSKTDKSLFSPNTLLLPSSEGIISEVSSNPNAIGYDGLGYIVPSVKTLGIATQEGADYVKPSVETVNDGTYSVSRDLYMYTRGDPHDTILDYLNWIRSPEAQQIVLKLGFVPILTEK